MASATRSVLNAQGLAKPRAAERWAKTAPRNRIQASPKVHFLAPLVAICRALLMEVPAAEAQYDALVDVMGKTYPGQLLSKVSRDKAPLRFWQANEKRWLREYSDAVEPLAGAYADRWLFHSPAGAAMVSAMSVVDLTGNVCAIEDARSTWARWANFYERRNRERVKGRALAQAEGWHGLDDDRLMREARIYVRAHHVHHGLRPALDELYRDKLSKDVQGSTPICIYIV